MKIPTSIIGIRSFTLIELLIVVVIIGVLTSFATLSINTVRPSESQVLFKNLENQINHSKKMAQLKNAKLRLIFNSNQTTIEQLDPATLKWIGVSDIESLEWNNVEMELDEKVIYISPNGQTTPANLKIIDGEKSYQLNIK
jgi:prepilin-type N-terminal cleavage/methylation domain-containing protein